jgi:quercetin dioxygenase-like cupin family protein
MTMSTTFKHVADARPYLIWPGAVARAVNGERTTLAVVDLEPNLAVAEHQHENEQVGIVLKGSITMTIGGTAKRLTSGDMYVIPSDVRHSAQTHEEGATVVDVFAPVRADWESKQRAEPSEGRWP